MYQAHIFELLQSSVSPVVMISGIGLLLLSMTNRFSRPVDGIRRLIQEREKATAGRKTIIDAEIQIFYKRCHLLRLALFLVCASLGFLSSIILFLFLAQLFAFDFSLIIKLLFVASLASLLGSLFFFMLDVRITLNSLRLEIASLVGR